MAKITKNRSGGAKTRPASQPPVEPPSAPPKPSDENERSGDKPSKASNISDRGMMYATILIAAGTLVSAGAIFMQVLVMVGGGRQTDQIIRAANGIQTAQGQLVLDNKQVLADNRLAL